jgi:hypothetical protein
MRVTFPLDMDEPIVTVTIVGQIATALKIGWNMFQILDLITVLCKTGVTFSTHTKSFTVPQGRGLLA